MFFLALKYLFSRRRQTLLTLLGIYFGTTAYVSINGFFLGFRDYLIEQLVSNSAHIHIQAKEDFITEHMLDRYFFGEKTAHVFWKSPPSGRKDNDLVENPNEWYKRLRADPRVEAFSPQLSTAVILSKNTANVTSTLIGCDPKEQQKITTINKYIQEGSFDDLSTGGNRIVIGEELRKKLGVRVSQNILISLPKGTPLPFKVVGIYKTGNIMSDTMAYAAINDVQRVSLTPNKVNEIGVKLKDFSEARDLALSWSQHSPEKIESWDQQNESIFNVFKIQDAVRYLTVATIMIVAGFGIYNVLNMTVMQKRKDVAILRSLGFNNKDIIFLFYSQGLILGISGAIMGLISGYFLCLFLQTIPFGGGPMGQAGHLKISMDIDIYIYAFIFAILATSIASILPAHSAGKLTPIDIIRAGAE